MREKELWRELNEYLGNTNEEKKMRKYAEYLMESIKNAKSNNKMIAIFGNGGSAADAQHWAGELVCTYKKGNREAYPALALATNSSVVTAWSNDKTFEEIFSRQINAFKNLIGVAIGISTSGRSKNVWEGLREARKNSIKTILISGNGIGEKNEIDKHIMLPSGNTAVIQTMTQVLYHMSCELLE